MNKNPYFNNQKNKYLNKMDRKYNKVELEIYEGNEKQKMKIKELWKLALDYDEKYKP